MISRKRALKLYIGLF